MIVIDIGELAAFGANANEISAGIVWAKIVIKIVPELAIVLTSVW